MRRWGRRRHPRSPPSPVPAVYDGRLQALTDRSRHRKVPCQRPARPGRVALRRCGSGHAGHLPAGGDRAGLLVVMRRGAGRTGSGLCRGGAGRRHRGRGPHRCHSDGDSGVSCCSLQLRAQPNCCAAGGLRSHTMVVVRGPFLPSDRKLGHLQRRQPLPMNFMHPANVGRCDVAECLAVDRCLPV